ncbi:MAG: 30S ribosomal protein S9 [Candidatus Diapherotrites archaeon]|nr:30S ribosomal protein S9 [Candidatus Diapherotrites archaeon]
MAAAKKTTKKSKAKNETLLSKGKRKTAIARASIKAGTGKIRINSVPIELFEPKMMREFVIEPLSVVGPIKDTVDIKISVKGGGVMGQAEAIRTSITKAIVAYSKSEELEEKIKTIDRSMLVDDPRRKESKKQLGPGARSKYQKSYR